MTEEQADSQPRTTIELLDRISRKRAALEQMAATLNDDALVATTGGWSAKDLLAHISAWERRLLAEMRGDEAAARFGLDETTHGSADTDTINAFIYSRHRDDSPSEVRAEFRASGEAVRSAIARLSDTDLAQDVRPEDPLVGSLVDLIAWDTFKHYPQHASTVAELTTDS